MSTQTLEQEMTVIDDASDKSPLVVAEPNPMQLISQALSSGTNPNDMTALYDLHERHEKSEAKKAYTRAVVGFQSDCPVIPKSKKGDRSKFAPYDHIMFTIKPLLAKWGLSIQTDTETKVTPTKFETGKRKGQDTITGNIVATIIVGHRDGHSETFTFTAPVDPEMYANDSQKTGSANSYAKRYGVQNALNIITSEDIDDDGASAQVGPSYIRGSDLTWVKSAMADTETSETAMLKWLNSRGDNIQSLETIPINWLAGIKKMLEQRAAS